MGWLLPVGIGCLVLAALLRYADRRRQRAHNLRVWSLLPQEVKDVYLANGRRPEDYR